MNTILITVDALRADHLGQYGYERETMPALDRLLADGTKFTNAFANGPYTRISVPSFHTSRYLAYERLDELPTIGSTVSDAGIQTAAIGTRTGFRQYEGGLMFDEFVDLGRDTYYEEANQTRGPIERLSQGTRRAAQYIGDKIPEESPVYEQAKRAYDAVLGEGFEFKGYTSAEVLTDTANDWLQKQGDDEFFLWLHYMEGHRPYGVHTNSPAYHDGVSETRIRELMKKAGTDPEAVSAAERETLIDLYDSDLRYCSQHLSRLFDELSKLDLWEETAILFSSDHGEEFGDHGKYFHRNYPYNELIHVPLITKTPEENPETISDQRELIDLAPTICALHDVETETLPFLGTNLFEGAERDVYSIGAQCSRESVTAARSDGWKYLSVGDDKSLFDLENDPTESKSVADEHSKVVSRFERQIPARLFESDPEQLEAPEDEVDEGHLEALGYLEIKD
ncbi:sulfatase [Natrinema longum]|uniref:Sulfatase n=1 Tax=Natrinema longum TaxID=370324 RepID=A0A8A2U5T2_9EURY|nr:sulfatase [Natrinema longum]MBZ6494569.1 sulfatase [Natrinema longum]QSW84111.1 sulfatase [Natrinema longum]